MLSSTMPAYGDALSIKQQGDSALYHQRYAEALRLYAASADAARHETRTDIWLRSMSSIGQVYAMLGNHDRALAYFKRVLPDASQVSDRDFKSLVLVGIISSLCQLGNTQEAELNLAQLAKHDWQNHSLGVYYQYYLTGLIAQSNNDHSTAAQCFKKAITYARTSKLPPIYETAATLSAGHSFKQENSVDTAAKYLMSASQRASAEGSQAWTALAYSELNDIYMANGDTTLALAYKKRTDSISQAISNPQMLATAENQVFHTEEKDKNSRIGALNDTVMRQRLVMAAFAALITAMAVLTYIIYRQKKKQEETLRLVINKEQEISRQDNEITKVRKEYLSHITDSKTADPTGALSGLFDRILTVFEKPEFVFSPQFNLAVLCKEVGSNRTYVSAAINQLYGKSFSSLLNERRVREGCNMLKNSQETVTEISHALGYNSPTRFISSFKAIMGMTPAVYRKLSKDGTADAQ